jgi:hypothetical protein
MVRILLVRLPTEMWWCPNVVKPIVNDPVNVEAPYLKIQHTCFHLSMHETQKVQPKEGGLNYQL